MKAGPNLWQQTLLTSMTRSLSSVAETLKVKVSIYHYCNVASVAYVVATAMAKGSWFESFSLEDNPTPRGLLNSMTKLNRLYHLLSRCLSISGFVDKATAELQKATTY